MSDPTGQPPSPPADNRYSGRWIGPYHLLEIIGEGGFGIVWRAERREPYQQLVALKMIKPGMGSDEVLARFEHERQALALMAHPHVAAVLDGGVSGPEYGDRPYFVMEYVPGRPITDYCDDRKLTIRERLELFIQVCDGVQHAHSKGLIHRDLTPRNILVVEHDGKPVPKIIDFGISKALGRPLTDKFIFTHDGRMLGVPEYISPEQAQGLDIDTRADVYSLGVLLYELLTGAPPFDRSQLFSKGWEGMLRFIREAERPRPSTRLSSLGDNLTAVAERRRVKPNTLQRELARDLEWIPLRALEAERTRRYPTPSALSADIQRYLDGSYDPPFGGRPLDNLRRFVRRNRRVLAVAALVVSALGLWLAGTLYQLKQTRIAKGEAIREAGAARAAEGEARDAELRANTSAYAANIAAAAGAIASDNCAAARDHLDACPTNLRGWEWRVLQHESDVADAHGSTDQLLHIAAFANDGASVHVLGAEFIARLGLDLATRVSTWKYRQGPNAVPRSRTESVIRLVNDGQQLLTAASLPDGRAELRLRARDDPSAVPSVVATISAQPEPRMLCASADGKTIAAVTVAQGEPRIALAASGSKDHLFALERSPSCLSMSEDGRRIVAAFARPDGGCLCRAWNCQTLLETDLLTPNLAIGERPTSLAVSNDGSVIAVAGENGAAFWRSGSPEPVVLRGVRGASCLSISPDLTWLAAGVGNRVLLTNIKTGDRALLRGHNTDVYSVAFSPDSGRVVSTTYSGSIRIWTVRPTIIQSPDGQAGGFTCSLDGSMLALFKPSQEGGVRLFDARARRWLDPVAPASSPRRACLAPSGDRLAIVDASGIGIYSSGSGQLLTSMPLSNLAISWDQLRPDDTDESPVRMVFVPGTPSAVAMVVLPQSGEGRVLIADCQAQTVRTLATCPERISVSLASDGARSLLMAFGHVLRVFSDAPDLHNSPDQFAGDFRPAQFVVSPDGRTAFGVNLSGNAWRCDLGGGKSVDVRGHGQGGRAAALLSGESRVVTGGKNGSLIVWSTDPLSRITAFSNEVRVLGLSFDAQSGTLWAAFADGSLRAMEAPR